jgi:hypothetical protein
MLTRFDLITAVSGELAGVLTLAGFTAADTVGNMKEPTDQTFRAMGVAEADLADAAVADGEEQKGIAFLTFFTVDKAVWNTANKMNVKAGSASAELETQHKNLLRLWAQALAEAQSYGLPVPGGGPGASGVIPIPYVGGISRSDYETVAADSDRLPLLFSRSDLVIPGVEPVEPWPWGEW